jgi:tripartite-type tricarboxylate transporter receptor subunit TctC
MRFARALQSIFTAAIALGAAGAAFAQDAWPARPVKLIAPFAPAGPLDLASRAISGKLQEALGQPVVVENVAGAGGAVGMLRLAQSPGDGYTLALGHIGSLSVGPLINPQIGYDPLKSFAPVSLLADYANVLMVGVNEPYANVAALIKAARENPGRIAYSSSGVGSSNHLSGELLAAMTGVKLTHIPTRGSAPAMLELIGGRVNFMFDVLLNSMPNLQAGKLRALAVTNHTGVARLPGVPPLSKTVPGYEVLGWVSLMAAAGTPPRVVERLHMELGKIMKMPEVIAQYATVGFDVRTSTPAELQTLMRKDLELWGPVIKAAGIKAE